MSDTEQIREQLLDIIATEGMIDRAKLTPDATLETIGMASYDMVMILMALEEKFGVYISVDSELTEVKTLNELLTVLSARIEAQKNAPAAAPEDPALAGAVPPPPPDSTPAATAAAVTVSTPASAVGMGPTVLEPVGEPEPIRPPEHTRTEAEAK
jgi:acyl carrier protein